MEIHPKGRPAGGFQPALLAVAAAISATLWWSSCGTEAAAWLVLGLCISGLALKARDKGSVFTKAKRRVAILGGSFNPITDAHLQMASEVVHAGVADEVWLVPCGPRPDKASLSTSVLDRYTMCHLAVNSSFGRRFPVYVKAFELEVQQAYKTADLLEVLDSKYGAECDISFVVGSDLLKGIPFWGGPSGWYMRRRFIVFPRPGFPIPDAWVRRQGSLVQILGPVQGSRGAPTLISSNLSSSMVRSRMEEKKRSCIVRGISIDDMTVNAEGLVPKVVLGYITRYNLYSESPMFEREAALAELPLAMPGRCKIKLLPSPRPTQRARPRVAILGGTFDPMTDAHLKCAAEVVHTGVADAVWIVPCGPRPDKTSLTTHSLDRLVMAHSGVQGTFSAEFPVYVIGIEAGLRCALTTPNLMAKLRMVHPEYDFAFVIGTDLLCQIPHWDAGDQDPQWYLQTDFIVLKRPNYPVLEEWIHRDNVHILDSPVHGHAGVSINTSSTEVRRRIARTVAGSFTRLTGHVTDSIEGLCALSTINHIQRYGIYTADRASDLRHEIRT